SAGLLPVEDVARLHDMVVQMREIESEVQRGNLLALKAETSEVLLAARQLLEQVEEAYRLLGEIDEVGEPWPHDLRKKCRQASFASERQAFEALFDEIGALTEARAEFLKHPVECPRAAVMAPKTREAIDRGAETGKALGMFSFAPAETKEHLAEIK